MSTLTAAPLGVLLAGGLSRRMGGGDKPLLTIGGRPILERAIARLAPQCNGLILNANGDPARFASFGLPVVADTVEGFAGPLAGILAALEWAAAHRPNVQWVLSASADTPFLPRDLAERLQQAALASDARIAVAESGGREHWVIGVWSVALRHELHRALVADGVRKVGSWLAQYKIAKAAWPAEPLDPFFNINTIEDRVLAEKLAALDEAT